MIPIHWINVVGLDFGFNGSVIRKVSKMFLILDANKLDQGQLDKALVYSTVNLSDAEDVLNRSGDYFIMPVPMDLYNNGFGATMTQLLGEHPTWEAYKRYIKRIERALFDYALKEKPKITEASKLLGFKNHWSFITKLKRHPGLRKDVPHKRRMPIFSYDVVLTSYDAAKRHNITSEINVLMSELHVEGFAPNIFKLPCTLFTSLSFATAKLVRARLQKIGAVITLVNQIIPEAENNE